MYHNDYIKISQLTEYQKRRLNRDRYCVICGDYIFDYDLINYKTRRHQHRVDYAFCHHKCFNKIEESDLFLFYERRNHGKESRLFSTPNKQSSGDIYA